MDISLYTSLYRTEAHLETYVARALHMIDVLNKAGITLELVLIANDASDFEREHIARLQAAYAHVQAIYVPRETLYASWNRGVRAARADVLAPWNVDDDFYPEAVIEGYKRVKAGCDVVYFGFDVVRINGTRRQIRHVSPASTAPEIHHKRLAFGPFVLFTRHLYKQLGGFHERFRVAGDFEFFSRAVDITPFCAIDITAGEFVLHGGNLSAGSTREWAEENIVYLLQNRAELPRACPPEAMRTVFSEFADEITLTPELERRLWGDIASEKWAAHERMLRRDRLREWPRRIVNALGLRPMLYRAGILKTPPQK